MGAGSRQQVRGQEHRGAGVTVTGGDGLGFKTDVPGEDLTAAYGVQRGAGGGTSSESCSVGVSRLRQGETLPDRQMFLSRRKFSSPTSPAPRPKLMNETPPK